MFQNMSQQPEHALLFGATPMVCICVPQVEAACIINNHFSGYKTDFIYGPMVRKST